MIDKNNDVEKNNGNCYCCNEPVLGFCACYISDEINSGRKPLHGGCWLNLMIDNKPIHCFFWSSDND